MEPRRALTCPVCTGSMVLSRQGEREGHSCARGDGIYLEPQQQGPFFSAQALRELRGRARQGPAASKFCPSCSRSMTRFRFRDHELDACGDCGGVWFDRGELRTLTFGDAPAAARPPTRFVRARPPPGTKEQP